jgi:hypothetical protein
MPWQNHSWHTTLYITARGLSTGSIPYENGIFAIEFDFESHQLIISTTFDKDVRISLYPRSVADFYQQVFQELMTLGIKVKIHAAPNELEDNTPFAQNHAEGFYDRQKVSDFWQVAVNIHNVFLKYRSEYIGKCSPVHFFWGAFDMAVTRFSGREAPLHPGEAPNMPKEVMQEAYSQEVSSAGFWPGSDQFPQPIFYSYSYPYHEGFAEEIVYPDEAFWSEEMGEFVLPYESVRLAEDPNQFLMDFLQSTYVAAAKRGQWDRAKLERSYY